MIIDCISDLHGEYPELEGGDLLIVAGDLTGNDTHFHFGQFDAWLDRQIYTKKIVIAGNHDNYYERRGFSHIQEVYTEIKSDYLCDSGTEFEGLKIWGSPWTKTFPGMNPHCKAFTVDTDEELADKWALIPDDVDILVTHCPPYGILDGIPIRDGSLFHVGSHSLLKRIKEFDKLKLHVFGHIHEGYGKEEWWPWIGEPIPITTTQMVNASHVNEDYDPVNKPVRVIL